MPAVESNVIINKTEMYPDLTESPLKSFIYIKSKFPNEPGSDPLLAWKRASWVQETCLLIQAAVLRTASRLFHKGLRVCFKEDYEHLFDVPQHSRTDNDVSGLSPIYIPAAG